MASGKTPLPLIIKLVREQGNTCVWCGKRLETKHAMPHHWLFKRSDNVPDEVLHSMENVVVLHHQCHMDYGQTLRMSVKCLKYKVKEKDYNINQWMGDLITSGRVKHYK